MHPPVSPSPDLEQAKVGSQEEIYDFLRDPQVSPAQRCALIDHLLATRLAVAHEALCDFFDVAVFKTGDTCFRDSSPVHEHELWFVSTLAGSGLTGVQSAPLAETREAAMAVAVEQLCLVQRLRGDATSAGADLS